MRVLLVLALVLAVAATLAAPAPAFAKDTDSASISRDSHGAQPPRDHDPLGGPPTPRVFLLSQASIFVFGVAMLVVAAALGAYTLLSARRPTGR